MLLNRIKRNILYTIISIFAVTLLWFVFIVLHPHFQVASFEKKINEVYENIEQEGEKFQFKGDSLIYWTTNNIPIKYPILDTNKIVFISNGIYLKKTLHSQDTTTLYLYLVKNNYKILNAYNQNKFNKPFSLNDSIDISLQKTNLPIKIGGQEVFYLDFSHYDYQPKSYQLFILDLLVIISVFFTLMMLISLIKKKPNSKIIAFFILLPVYIINVYLVYFLCSHNPNISFYLYSSELNYNNILFFIILTVSGFIVYTLSNKFFSFQENKRFALSRKILVLLMISIIYGTIMEVFNHNNIERIAEQKALSLANRRNPETEANFVNHILSLESDEEFAKFINNKQYALAEDYVVNDYFKSIAENYHVGTLIFKDNDSMLVEPMHYYVNILSYVENRIRQARRIDSVMCWVEDNENDNNNTYIYLCKSDEVNIFVECLKKKNSKNMNYSLLLSPKESREDNLFSYARYHNQHLIYSYGERNFENTIKNTRSIWKNEKQYRTFYLQDGNNTYLVCYPYRLPYNILGAISLFFLLLIIISGIDFLISSSTRFKSFSPGIRSSILLSLVGSFVIGIIISGFFSIRSINSFNRTFNQDILKEKTTSVKIEIENFLKNNSKDDLQAYIINLSNTFLTDINLFDTNYTLVYTSQKSVFEQGFLLDKINPKAKDVKNDVFNLYTTEKIGELNFSSSYATITDDADRALYYLNIPFINQQKRMEENINNLINNFINMFLFWVNISIIIFILVSDFITKPLQILKDKLKKVDIDGKNEKIIWEKNDEIGELIKTYNQMIEKIEESSILLKQQERNTSWRELANQVAHDINNPLTPMKLSIQYLQKIYNEKPELFEKKFATLAPSLISQIDSISTIASELNNYSKPSTSKKEKTDIIHCLTTAKNLFENTNDIKINISTPKQHIFVVGELQPFVRIFNNLLKNAYQAIREKEDGKINITVKEENSLCIVSIYDNGCGIKEEDFPKIFTPHFTTKQDGNGIGLTIVKNIIESYDGTISFLSKENEGTTFNISLNLFEN